MKKIVFYDLDGTLVDTRADIATAVNHMLVKLGESPLPQNTIEQFVGHGIRHLLRGCLNTDDVKFIEKGKKAYVDFYGKHMLDETDLYPDALLMLECMKDKHQAVVTNKPNPFSDNILEALKVSPFFVKIVAGNSTYPSKPDPEAVIQIMKELGVEKQEAVFIGDSAVDVETGQRAGIQTVMLTHGFGKRDELEKAGADKIVNNFKELLKFTEEDKW